MTRRLALFVDRREAGRRLAPTLERFREPQPAPLLFDLLTAEEEPDRADVPHLFEEPGALDRVAQLAAKWLTRHSALQKA